VRRLRSAGRQAPIPKPPPPQPTTPHPLTLPLFSPPLTPLPPPSLTAGAFQLPLGQLADLVGRKPTFLAGQLSFAVAAAAAGSAATPLAMDALCGLLGVCAALAVPPAAGLLGAAYAAPSRRKNLAFSAFSAGNPLGFALGSLLCGLAERRAADWRAAFRLLALLWGGFALLAVWAVPAGAEAGGGDGYAGGDGGGGGRRARLARFGRTFDFVGAALVLCGTGGFSAAITSVFIPLTLSYTL